MVCSAWLVEPLTALLMVAASYGASALVKSLGGGPELSSLSGDLVKALTETESRIDERLAGIELKLDELLEQRYSVAIRTGVRFLLDAVQAAAPSRTHDLNRARDSFIEAQSAARSSLQEAVAERYLLLCLFGLQRSELVTQAVIRMEGLAMKAAFEAMFRTEYNREQAAALMQREGSSLRHPATPDRRRRAKLQVKGAALDTISYASRLLGEAAMFAQVAGLPPRVTPPLEAIADSTLVEGAYMRGGTMVTPRRPNAPDKAYWTFTITSGETLRIGPLSVQIRPGPARRAPQQPHKLGFPGTLFPATPDPTREHVRLELARPLPPLRVEVSTAGPHAPHPEEGAGRIARGDTKLSIRRELAWNEDTGILNATRDYVTRDWSAKLLDSGATEAELSIPPLKPGSAVPVLTISPQDMFRNLIEVTCIT